LESNISKVNSVRRYGLGASKVSVVIGQDLKLSRRDEHIPAAQSPHGRWTTGSLELIVTAGHRVHLWNLEEQTGAFAGVGAGLQVTG
jgi:hypothetical protein